METLYGFGFYLVLVKMFVNIRILIFTLVNPLCLCGMFAKQNECRSIRGNRSVVMVINHLSLCHRQPADICVANNEDTPMKPRECTSKLKGQIKQS